MITGIVLQIKEDEEPQNVCGWLVGYGFGHFRNGWLKNTENGKIQTEFRHLSIFNSLDTLMLFVCRRTDIWKCSYFSSFIVYELSEWYFA